MILIKSDSKKPSCKGKFIDSSFKLIFKVKIPCTWCDDDPVAEFPLIVGSTGINYEACKLPESFQSWTSTKLEPLILEVDINDPKDDDMGNSQAKERLKKNELDGTLTENLLLPDHNGIISTQIAPKLMPAP